jgi:hypothetical protein
MLRSQAIPEDALLVRAVKAVMSKDLDKEPSIRELANSTSLPPTKVHELLSTTIVSRTPRNSAQMRRTRELRAIAQDYVGFPWKTDMWLLCDQVNSELDEEFHFEHAGKMALRRQTIRARVVEAIELWLPHARQPSNAPASRLFYGYMAGRVLLKVLTEPRQTEALEDCLEDIDLSQTMQALDALESLLMDLVSDKRAAQLYGKPLEAADQRGLQWIRHALFTNRIGRARRNSVGSLEELYQGVLTDGYLEACDEVIAITGDDDLVPILNGWTACTMAGAWDKSREMSKRVFKTGPDLLWSKRDPAVALVRDIDSWPGLAAIVADPELKGLAEVQHWLVSVAPNKTNASGAKPYLTMHNEVLRMAKRLRANPDCSYSELRNSIKIDKEKRV